MVKSSGQLFVWFLRLGVWIIFSCAPAFADPCAERAQRVRTGEVPFGEEDPDCAGAEKTGALIAWLAAAAAAAAAARQVKEGKSVRPDDWPTNLKGPNAFCDLGHAIAKEEYLQKQVPTAPGGSRGLTEVEKTLYIFERMREAARVYNLRASYDVGQGIPLVSYGIDQGLMLLSRREERAAALVNLVPTIALMTGGYLLGGAVAASETIAANAFVKTWLPSLVKGLPLLGSGLSGAVGYFASAFTLGNDVRDRALSQNPSRRPSGIVTAAGAFVGGSLGFFLGGPVGGLAGAKLAGAITVGAGLGSYLGYRWATGTDDDPEYTDGLKTFGVGNCGEWTWAFKRVLECAGIKRGDLGVVFADKSAEPGLVTPGFGSNDTALSIPQDIGGGRKAARIFDIFRQMLHDRANDPQSPSRWSNLPPTPNSRLGYDDQLHFPDPKNPHQLIQTPTWIDKMGKPILKDDQQSILWSR